MKKRYLAIFLTTLFLTQGVVPAMGELEEAPTAEEFNIEDGGQDEAFFEDAVPEEESFITEEPAEELLGAEEETILEEETALSDDGWFSSDEELLEEEGSISESTAEISEPDSLVEEYSEAEPEEAGVSLAEAEEEEPELLEEITDERDPEEPLEVGTVIASGKCGKNISWELESDGTLTLTGNGKMSNFEWWNGVPWADRQETIKKIVFNGSIESVGDYSFSSCTNLKSITLPESISSIGKNAFAATGLTSLTIPGNIKSIGEYAFTSCHNLKNLVLLGSVEVLENTFKDCDSLEKVEISYGVKSILGAFESCKSLKSVTLPASVTTLGEWAFCNCRSLQYITIPDSVTKIDDSAFSNCLSLIAVKIGNKVSSIGEYGFHQCESLGEVVIPPSVKSIEERAFADCTKLKKIVFLGNAPTFTEGRIYDYDEDDWVPSESHAFENINATAYYPGDNSTWTIKVMKNYGGKIIWKPYYNSPPLMPSKPRLIAAYNGSKGIGIKFVKAAYATEYVIYRKYNGSWSRIETVSAKSSKLQASGDTLMYTDTTVASNYGKGYIYSVASKNETGTSSYDKVGKAIYRLKPPTLTKATNSAAGTATVYWKGVFGRTETNGNYDLQYAEYANGKAGTFKSVEKLPGFKNLTLYARVSGLKKGKKYVFRIRCSKTNKDRGTFYSEYSPWLSVNITR